MADPPKVGAGLRAGSQTNRIWMARALRLAARGRGRVSPNPLVGAVVVKNGRAAGTGYHRRYGGDHAEVEALRRAGRRAQGSTLYVNLEPCCHWGKTPPCLEAIIAAGVRKVVIAHRDPNPIVKGKGIRGLRRAGIETEVGVLAAEARRLNEAYLKRVESGLPFVALKLALSLDGKSATAGGESKYLTGRKARALTHRLRSQHDGVMVGVGTVLADDPRLTVRLARGRDPVRVVVDSRLRTPQRAQVLANGSPSSVIAAVRGAPPKKAQALKKRGARLLLLAADAEGRVSLRPLLRALARLGMNSLLVEGGPTLAGSLLDKGLVDRVYFFLAPCLLGGEQAPGAIGGGGVRRLAQAWRVRDLRVRKLGEDFLFEGDVERRRS